MDRRTLLKLLGGVAALPALGKAIKGVGIKTAKVAAKVLPKVSGMPDWFPTVVAKINKEGKLATEGTGLGDNLKIKELTIPSKTGTKGVGDEIYTMIEYPDGRIEIQANIEGGAYGQPFELHYTPPKTDIDVTTGKPIKEPGDFSIVEQRPKPDPNDPGNYEFDWEAVSKDEALSDLEKVEKITTGKIKNLTEAEKRAAQRKGYYDSPYDDISNRYPEPDYADGGIASFINGGKVKKLKDEDENENMDEDEKEVVSIFGQKLAGPVKGELFLEPVEKRNMAVLPKFGGVEELKEYVKQQTPKGLGIGYSGPDYGLMTVKPLFQSEDKRPLIQGYYKAGENKFIKGSLGPKEQTLDYSLGNYDPDPESTTSGMNIGFSRNTYSGKPEYMFNIGARFANGGLTKTVPPVSGPDPQGVETLFKRRYR